MSILIKLYNWYICVIKNNMLNLILFGKPGSGKGTQANLIKNKYNLVHISTGDVFRKSMSNKTDLGMLAKGYMEKGELVPDEVTVNMLKEELEDHLPCEGFIFDGFPRTSYQAEKLDALLTKYSLNIHLTIALDVDNQTLIKRLLNRGKSSGRADDQSEDKIKKRLQEYDKKTKPLIEFYTKQNKYKSINGIGEMDDITARIVNLLDNYLNDRG